MIGGHFFSPRGHVRTRVVQALQSDRGIHNNTKDKGEGKGMEKLSWSSSPLSAAKTKMRTQERNDEKCESALYQEVGNLKKRGSASVGT